MSSTLEGLERFLGIGLAILAGVLMVAIGYGLVLLKRFGGSLAEAKEKKAKPLPQHKIEPAAIDERWADESGYEKMLERLHKEIVHAINHQDNETLEIITQGTAQALFKQRLQSLDLGSDKREVLQGSVRQSWDPKTHKLVVILAVSRFVKGWRRCYEEWTLQKQGNAWFVVAAKPTRL